MTWPAEIRDTILERIAADESLRSICRDENMPGERTVHDWLEADEDFRSKYLRARERQADSIVDGFSALERQVLSGEVKPDAAKVVLWSRQWRAEKLKPKAYGAKLDLNHSGGVKFDKIVVEVVKP